MHSCPNTELSCTLSMMNHNKGFAALAFCLLAGGCPISKAKNTLEIVCNLLGPCAPKTVSSFFALIYTCFRDSCTFVHLAGSFMLSLVFSALNCVRGPADSVRWDERHHVNTTCLVRRPTDSQNLLHLQPYHFLLTRKSNVMCLCSCLLWFRRVLQTTAVVPHLWSLPVSTPWKRS